MEKMTMEERIQAFYRQSGGPNNPEIERILENHLRYGKDHGIRGKIETIEDAIRDALTDDKSTSLIVDWLAEKRIESLSQRFQEENKYNRFAQEVRDGFQALDNGRLKELALRVHQLQKKVDLLKELIEEYR